MFVRLVWVCYDPIRELQVRLYVQAVRELHFLDFKLFYFCSWCSHQFVAEELAELVIITTDTWLFVRSLARSVYETWNSVHIPLLWSRIWKMLNCSTIHRLLFIFQADNIDCCYAPANVFSANFTFSNLTSTKTFRHFVAVSVKDSTLKKWS